MPRHQYQGTPTQPPPLTATVRSGSVIAMAGTKYLWLQYRSRAGYSLPSTAIQIAVAVGQGVDITIPAGALPSPNGCCIWEYTVLMSDSSSISNACVVATYPGYLADQITVQSPPFTISLLTDEQFRLSGMLAYASQLPQGDDLVHGMRRYVDVDDTYIAESRPSFQAKIVEWDQIAGLWRICKPSIFNTTIADITGVLGADQDAAAMPDLSIVIYPDYNMEPNEVSVPVGYWLVNDGTQTIAQGTRVGVTIENGDEDVSYALGIIGGIRITFRGYVDVATGVLDTSDGTGTMDGVDVTIAYQGKQTGLTLPKDLPPGAAYWIDVQAKITPDLLNGRITEGSSLKFSAYFFADFAIWNPSGNLFGDFIANEFGRRRILPDAGLTAVAQTGSGNIILSTGGSLSFYNVGAQALLGFAADTANQSVWIGVDGTCLTAPTQPNGTRKRAIVSTTNGAGKATDWSDAVTLDGGTLITVTVTMPATIRADYPDVIASTTVACNATSVRFYVIPDGGGDILQFDELIVAGESEQSFTIGSSGSTDIGTELPDAPASAFGLFEPTSYTVGTTTGDSEFSSGLYRVSIAFLYSNTITAISHDPANGCIYEAAATLAQVFDRSNYHAEGVSDLAALRGLALNVLHDMQARTVRNVGGSIESYIYDASQTCVDDGTDTSLCVRPTAVSEDQPGRFVAYNRLLQMGVVAAGWSEYEYDAKLRKGGAGYFLDLTLPPGPPGPPGPRGPGVNLTIGSVEVGWEGQANATITGTSPDLVLDLVFPIEPGPPGMTGRQGETGEKGDTGDPMDPYQFLLFETFFC